MTATHWTREFTSDIAHRDYVEPGSNWHTWCPPGETVDSNGACFALTTPDPTLSSAPDEVVAHDGTEGLWAGNCGNGYLMGDGTCRAPPEMVSPSQAHDLVVLDGIIILMILALLVLSFGSRK